MNVSAATKHERDLAVITRFIEVFCRQKHRGAGGQLCPDCRELLEYAAERLARCPMDPKPKCKDCPTHCYKPTYRQRVKEVMRFSGIYFVKRGRLDWLIKYFT
jgi:hypothetical protein